MKFVLFTLPIFGVLGFIYWYFNQPIFNFKDTVLSEVISPEKKWTLTTFIRDGGATTDYSTILSIRKEGEVFNPEYDAILFVISGKAQLSMVWKDEKQVLVKYPLGRIFKQETKWKDLQIIYQQEN